MWSRGKHSLLCLSFSPNFWAKVKPAALKVLVSKHDHLDKQHVNYAENAAEVGGRASIGCPYLTNNSRRQLSKQLLVQSYINTTKRSIVAGHCIYYVLQCWHRAQPLEYFSDLIKIEPSYSCSCLATVSKEG